MTKGTEYTPITTVLVVRNIILNESNQILLVKRDEYDASYPGAWECAGGKVDRDEELEEADIRETQEESGLTTTSIHPLFHRESHQITEGKYQGSLYVAFFGLVRATGGKVTLNPQEHSAHVWTTYPEVYRYDLTLESRNAHAVFEPIVRALSK